MTEYLKKHPYLLLIIISGFLFLIGNNLAAITDTAESNYALTAKEMVLSGDWMSPQIYGRYWYDKPIFYYWELSASFAALGFNEFAARLPSVILGTLSVLYTYWFASRIYGRKIGWLSAIILMTSFEFWLLSKTVITDATLFLFMSMSVSSFYLGYTESRKYYYLCYIFAAFAVLTKGPIGLLLPGFSALVFLLWRRDIKEMLHVHLVSGLALFLIVCAPWYAYMVQQHGTDFLLNFFGVHNFLRATMAEHQNTNHWWFYIMMYFVGFMPWSFITIPTLFRKWKRHELSFKRADAITQFLLIWAFSVLLVFQIIATKYTTYTFPSIFAFAILSAKILDEYTVGVKWKAIVTGAVYIVLVLTVAPIATYLSSGKGPGLLLASMDTGNKKIVYENGYRTSTVFYSGKTIYQLVPEAKMAGMEPGTLSWNAKNVMPLYPEEQLKEGKEGYISVFYPKKATEEVKIIDVEGENANESTDYRGGRVYRVSSDWLAILAQCYGIR